MTTTDNPTRPTPAEVDELLANLPDEITNAGRALTLQIAPAIAGRHESTRPGTQRVCTRIAALAADHQELAEADCNYGLSPEEETQREVCREQIEEVVAALPWWLDTDTDEQRPWGVRFSGDPRGITVKLTGSKQVYDSWGGDGVCVPVRDPNPAEEE